MNRRILMLGNDDKVLQGDAATLRSIGFNVCRCTRGQGLNDVIAALNPEVVFINSRLPDKQTTDVYHWLIDNVLHACLPVVFTLAKNELYLVNKKRTAFKDRRYSMSHSMEEAIRMALLPDLSPGRRRIRLSNPFLFGPFGANRA